MSGTDSTVREEADRKGPIPLAAHFTRCGLERRTSRNAASEGSFAFSVTRFEVRRQDVGPADLSQQGSGQFCLVDVTVQNVGATAAVLDSSAQKAIDDQGKQYP